MFLQPEKSSIKPATRGALLTNPANKWAKHRKPDLIRKVSPRQTWLSTPRMQRKTRKQTSIRHTKQTPLSRTGPRGRKEKFADINKHPEAYKVECHKHHLTDKAPAKHDQNAALREAKVIVWQDKK